MKAFRKAHSTKVSELLYQRRYCSFCLDFPILQNITRKIMDPTKPIKGNHDGVGGSIGIILVGVELKDVVSGMLRGFLKYNGLLSNTRKSSITQAVGMNGPEITMSPRVA